MRRPEDHAAPVQDVGLLGLAEDHWDLLRRDVAHLAQKPRRGARHDPEVGGRGATSLWRGGWAKSTLAVGVATRVSTESIRQTAWSALSFFYR